MKTFAKCALAATIAAAALAFSAFAAYFAVTNDVKLDTNKLINYGQSITFYDADGNKIGNQQNSADQMYYKTAAEQPDVPAEHPAKALH